ncbi:HEAT repeat domain-containing protein [Nitrosomonas sp.]|uniref:HEAT repeat domain-containing protein n=1 Tax=Nitrosomonas sp. TaxID=42353 RepID=UPI00273049AC|nr:HEAT repeat domain-containing protein [Nitrosomonas sp.]MDP2223025.1 HEAT repeat domain-containing protein [Nitrosomonas sp.]
MPSPTPSVLDRYLDKVIQDNKTIDARGVMQVTRMIELSMEDVFIHLTVRMNRSDKWSSLLDTINLSHTYSESDPPYTRKPIPRVPEILGQFYFDYGETEKGVSTDNLWQRHSTWVLLGDPGAGKTTLLKHFALQEGTTYKTGNGYLPIFLPLRLFGKKLVTHLHWPLEEAILNYLTEEGLIEMGFADEQERQALRDSFQSALAAGRALLLLDGLDEQRDQHVQKRTVETIESLHRLYPGNRFVVTSRIVGYDAAPLGATFNTATLEPFTDEQMSQFFHQWCYAVEKNEDVVADEHTQKRADDKAAQLLEQINQNPGIRLLATNPLLCTIIGLIQRQGATLPQLRAELYKLCIDTFIFNWELKKRHREDQTGSLDKDQTQAVLEEIALQLHEHHPENRIPRDKLIDIVSQFLIKQQGMPEIEAQHKAGQLLNLIRDVSGLLIDRGNEEYGFFHLTFQEYLAARAITRKKRDIDRYLSQYLFEPRWREVIRLAAAHQGTKDEESGSEFIAAILRQKHPRDDLMHYTFRFAFLCLKEARVEMATSDRMFYQWIEYFLKEKTTQRLFLQLFEQPGAKIRYQANTMQPLIAALVDKNSTLRSSAAEALGKIGDKTAVDALILTLQDEDSTVRWRTISALGEIGDKTAVDALILALKDEDSDFRRNVAEALKEIGDKTTVDALILALEDEDPSVRSSAANSLWEIGDKTAVDALILALEDEDPYVRFYAALAMGKIGDKSAIDALMILALKDEDSNVRSSAALALGEIGDKTAVDALILTLQDEDSTVRWRTASALGKIGDKTAVDALILALKDEDSDVRSSAAEALGEIGDKTTIDALILALKDEDSTVRLYAALALGEIGDKTAVDALILALKDEDSTVRSSAANALEKIGEKTVVDALILALRDEDSSVRSSAANALEKIGDKTAVDVLILALNDEDSTVRLSAIRAIEKIDLSYHLCPN